MGKQLLVLLYVVAAAYCELDFEHYEISGALGHYKRQQAEHNQQTLGSIRGRLEGLEELVELLVKKLDMKITWVRDDMEILKEALQADVSHLKQQVAGVLQRIPPPVSIESQGDTNSQESAADEYPKGYWKKCKVAFKKLASTEKCGLTWGEALTDKSCKKGLGKRVKNQKVSELCKKSCKEEGQ